MSVIRFRCGSCHAEITMGSPYWGRKIKCASCAAVMIVPTESNANGPREVAAVMEKDLISPVRSGAARNISSDKISLVTVTVGVLAIIAMLTWFHFIRDTWESDNLQQISARCEALQSAIAKSDDAAASQAFSELNRFIGERKIRMQFLSDRIVDARQAFAPVAQRIEQAHLQAAAEQKREQQQQEFDARAKRQSLAQGDTDSFFNPDRNPPYLANQSSGHQSRDAAIAALAAQFERSMDWVERNMGSSNSLTTIHANLVHNWLNEEITRR